MTNYQEKIQALRAKYPNGTRIRMIEMDDPDPIQPGEVGTINGVDGVGTLLVDWDNGRTLGVLVGVDQFAVIA